MDLVWSSRMDFRGHVFPFLRNRVVTEFSGKRMAAQEPLRAKPNAARQSESLDGFVGIARARRLETAASGNEHGQVSLVEAQQEERSSHVQGHDRSRPY